MNMVISMRSNKKKKKSIIKKVVIGFSILIFLLLVFSYIVAILLHHSLLSMNMKLKMSYFKKTSMALKLFTCLTYII